MRTGSLIEGRKSRTDLIQGGEGSALVDCLTMGIIFEMCDRNNHYEIIMIV